MLYIVKARLQRMWLPWPDCLTLIVIFMVKDPHRLLDLKTALHHDRWTSRPPDAHGESLQSVSFTLYTLRYKTNNNYYFL